MLSLEDMMELVEAEEKRLGVGSEEFLQRHEELMDLIDKAMQKGKEADGSRREVRENGNRKYIKGQ